MLDSHTPVFPHQVTPVTPSEAQSSAVVLCQMNNLIPRLEAPPQDQQVSGASHSKRRNSDTSSFPNSCLEADIPLPELPCQHSFAQWISLFISQVTQMSTATQRHQHVYITYFKPSLGLNKILAAFILCAQGFVFLRMTCGSRSCFTAWEQKSQLCFIKNFIYLKT